MCTPFREGIELMNQPKKDDTNLQEQKQFHIIRLRYLKRYLHEPNRTRANQEANQKRINYNHESNNKTQS
jgi:hypothetical protein